VGVDGGGSKVSSFGKKSKKTKNSMKTQVFAILDSKKTKNQ